MLQMSLFLRFGFEMSLILCEMNQGPGKVIGM